MANNRPRSREKNVTGKGKGLFRRGSGLGTGKVGQGSGLPSSGSSGSFKPTGSSGSFKPTGSSGSSGGLRSAGKLSPILIIIVIAFFLFGGGDLSALFGGSSTTNTSGSSGGSMLDVGSVDIGSLLGNITGSSSSSGWELEDNTAELDTSVSKQARERYTTLKGNGKDTVTVMVYLCGTDLESRSGMATSDLQEMLAADIGDNVNLIVYTGGCKQWKNNVVSNKVNQIYQIKGGKLYCVDDNAGTGAMTNPDTLSSFIKFCAKNYPANRNMLIFWDHGGGSISGYGYDEKKSSSGTMDLAEINQAMKAGGVKFDIVGFDTCLMATLETAVMMSQYADYMVASEETEPGVGWYYTDWLTELSENTSISSVKLGKIIVDDFVDTCAKKCPGQKTTLSVVDLAELEVTLPDALKEFSISTSELIQENEYKTVSNARNNAREFASSTKIDQVDLVHLAKNMGTQEGKDLANTILSAVKYNRTSSNMTNAYGLSIYFPYQRVSNVDNAVETYELIGMDEEYARCIQEFASVEVSGQVATGGTTSPLPALLGSLLGGGDSSSGNVGADLIGQLLGGMLSGNTGITGLSLDDLGFLDRRSLTTEETAEYLAENRFDSSKLVWQSCEDGIYRIGLTEEQWALVQGLELNMFYDDGEGYIDLGLDNVFEFDDYGALLGQTDGTWLAINDQVVAYYHTGTVDDGTNYTITGEVPVMLNGQRANLLLVFDNENPYGYIAGARIEYAEGETETVAKSDTQLQVGDKIDFICDYYGYDGTYLDSYYLGEQMTVTERMVISNVYLPEAENICASYRFTDIYNQHYWTNAIP